MLPSLPVKGGGEPQLSPRGGLMGCPLDSSCVGDWRGEPGEAPCCNVPGILDCIDMACWHTGQHVSVPVTYVWVGAGDI